MKFFPLPGVMRFSFFQLILSSLAVSSIVELHSEDLAESNPSLYLRIIHSDLLIVEGDIIDPPKSFEIPRFRYHGVKIFTLSSIKVTKVIHKSKMLEMYDPILATAQDLIDNRYQIPVVWDSKIISFQDLAEMKVFILEFNPSFDVYEFNILLQHDNMDAVLEEFKSRAK